jgi:hypothetical protein
MRITARSPTPLTLCFLLFAFSVKAESQFSITPTLLHFDYTEFSNSGSVLDKETGWIPGMQLHLNTPLNEQWRVGFELAAYDGSVNYEGNTQTTTQATIYRFGASIETQLTPRTDLVFGIKHNEWQRDIQDSNTLLGPYEIYRWWETSIGISTQLWAKEKQSWRAEATLLRTVNPTIHVDLSKADLGKTDLDLGTEWGSRLQLSWTHETSAEWQHGLKIFYEAWDFGRSDFKNTSGGTGSLLVAEPRSETRHSGLLLVISKHF